MDEKVGNREKKPDEKSVNRISDDYFGALFHVPVHNKNTYNSQM
jgi:hypothetical protein